MKFVVTEGYYFKRDEFDTLDEARAKAASLAEEIANENYPVTVSLIVPMEEYKYVEPVRPDPTVVCSCVTVRTCEV